jgi:hypothetical protein
LSGTSTRLVVKDSPWVATLERWLERDGKPVVLKLGRRPVDIIVSLGNFGAHFAPARRGRVWAPDTRPSPGCTRAQG